MLSGDAAEGEDSSEREKGQSTLSQPSGTTLSQPSGTPPSQPSCAQSPLTQPSGKQSPSCLPEGAVASPVPVSVPMPLLIGHHPETVRLLPPRNSKAISVVAMSLFQRGDSPPGTNHDNTDRWKDKANDRGEHG
jgi:hypothetical protein